MPNLQPDWVFDTQKKTLTLLRWAEDAPAIARAQPPPSALLAATSPAGGRSASSEGVAPEGGAAREAAGGAPCGEDAAIFAPPRVEIDVRQTHNVAVHSQVHEKSVCADGTKHKDGMWDLFKVRSASAEPPRSYSRG